MSRKLYSDEHCILAVRLLALRLRRTPLAKEWSANGCRPHVHIIFKRWASWDGFIQASGLPKIPTPGPVYGRGARRHRRFWTDRQVAKALRILDARFPEDLRDPSRYCRASVGRLGWPTPRRIREFGGRGAGSWRRALNRAGVKDVKGHYQPWTRADEWFLLDNAGRLTLKQIGKKLGRSWNACKRRLYDLGTRARDARGYLTAQGLAQRYNVSLHRVYDALREGRLRATRPRGRPYWQIDPESVEENLDWLTAPKKTHKKTPPRVEDHYQLNGLKRSKVAGRFVVVGKREEAA